MQSRLCITINSIQIKLSRRGEYMQLNNQDPRMQSNDQLQPNFVGPNHQALQNRGVRSKKMNKMNLRWLSTTLVVLIGVLVVLIVLAVLFYKPNTENGYVNNSTYQSVDINVNGSTGGQIYFGKITAMNSSYIAMDDVFYLQPGTSSNQFTLNSLTCTLYNPQDQIIINRSQVAFWENLSSKSQVVTDINKWHTDKLQCSTSTPSTTSGTSTTSSTDTTTK